MLFQVDRNTIDAFVDEVMDLVELGSLRDSVVGVPGVSGLSVEQRKRLTIAVELVRSHALCCGCLQPYPCGLCLSHSVAALFCNAPLAVSCSIAVLDMGSVLQRALQQLHVAAHLHAI